LPSSSSLRFWIVVATQDHVELAVAGAYVQVNHGRAGPLERMRAGDGFAWYSPRVAWPGGAPLQAFTALGRIGNSAIRQVDAVLFDLGVSSRQLDMPLVDDLLQHLWFVLPLTWFMVAGACNAVNLIDGAHGLAGGTALIMFGGIALAAGWSGDAVTLNEALVVMGALVGFLVWNYPRGRIFLGDAGAYFIGFMYAELSIQLIAHNSGLSAWYVIMLAGYPIVDTLFAMYRRGVVRRVPLMEPDALHLHSLVFRRVAMPIQRQQKRWSLRRANARVAPRMWLHSAVCFALAVFFRDNTVALWGCLGAYTAFYVSQYRALVRFRGKGVRRWSAVANKTSAKVKPGGA